MASTSRPDPKPATAPNPDEDEDDFDPQTGAPRPPKASKGHPVVGNQGEKEPREPGSNFPPPRPGAGQGSRDHDTKEPKGQAPLTSAERPKLGSRVHPALKQALKIAAAIEGRKEEALVEQALTAYLYQHHPRTAAAYLPEEHSQPAAQGRVRRVMGVQADRPTD